MTVKTPVTTPGFPEALQAAIGRQYRIDSTSSLPHWQDGVPFNATRPYEEFSDFPFDPQFFYRVALMPP